jgi:hypothetical protein
VLRSSDKGKAMNSNKYSPDQWALMNLPATQEKIQRELRSTIVRFLDTAPEKALLFRVSAILGILKYYFEEQLAREDGDAYDDATAKEALVWLSLARRRMRTDEDVEKWVASIMASPPMTDEELKQWEALEALLKAEGKEHWD